MSGFSSRFEHWSTGSKLLLLLTAALLPLGMALAWTAWSAMMQLNRAALDVTHRQSLSGARAIEGALARNALALKVAANGAIRDSGAAACDKTALSLALTPSVAPRFTIRNGQADILCTRGNFVPRRNEINVAPGSTSLWVSPADQAIYYRVGVIGGMATGSMTAQELATAIKTIEPAISGLVIRDDDASLRVIGTPQGDRLPQIRRQEFDLGGGQLRVESMTRIDPPGVSERAAVLLPLVMLIVAVILSWLLVRRMLILPLARLQRVVNEYQPGGEPVAIPEDSGSAEEIRLLGQSFERAVQRIEQSEIQMAEALVGQRKLVREVHHRVKNNLQVIASMLSIHGRSAATPESRAAYAAMGRRVDALSVVHRNHFAEVEENRGIALRPLLVELAATLRASAPDPAHPPAIQLEIDDLYTTQDAAVAVSFFVTEVVEHAMLTSPKAPTVEISLKRNGELGGSLSVASDALIRGSKDEQNSSERTQFDRVIQGLARQLRSPLDEKLGRLGVDLPVFPQ
jgi:two-component sensor histidine kinase